MKSGRAMSLCVQCVLLLIVFACSLSARGTALGPASASPATAPFARTAQARAFAQPSLPHAEAVAFAFAQAEPFDAERLAAAGRPARGSSSACARPTCGYSRC